MRAALLFTCLFLFSLLGAQDRIVLLNGAEKKGRILEIGPEIIKYDYEGIQISVATDDVLFLEFKNGTVEIINTPEKSVVYVPREVEDTKPIRDKQQVDKNNLITVNTLGLLNADAALFYERFFAKKQIGLSLMGAYNFNNYVGAANIFLITLSNAKKHYDLGAMLSYYFAEIKTKRQIYAGVLFKYTYFTFSRTVLAGTPPGSVINYVPSSGYQMATIFTIGTQQALGENFVIKTIFGLGGFNLKDNYFKEYNYQRGQVGQNNISFLPKFYFGINAGFTF